jgi:hypothetical protein
MPRSSDGIAIPVLRFGSVRLPRRLLWYADFTSDQRAHPAPEQTRRFDFRLKPKIEK